MSIKKKLFSNTLSNGLQFGSRWVMNVLLAQNTSLSTFGSFSFIYTLATLIATFFTFGSNLYMLNKNGDASTKSLQNLYTSFTISGLLFTLLTFIFLVIEIFSIFVYSYSGYLLYAFLLAFIWSINMNLFSFFKSLGLFVKEAKAYFVFSILLLFCLGLAHYFSLFVNLNLKSILITLIILNAIPTIIGFYNLKTLFSLSFVSIFTELKISFRNLKTSIKERSSYGIHELQSILFSNLPFLMMGVLMTAKDLGEYRAIYILIVPLLLLPVIISQVLLNQLALTRDDHIIFKKMFRKFSVFTGLIGLFIVFVYLNLGDYIINIVYEDKFKIDTSYQLLSIFVITAFLWFVKSNYEVLLTSLGQQWVRVKVLWGMLILYPLFIFILPNELDTLKYAYAGLFTTFTMLILYIVYSEMRLARK